MKLGRAARVTYGKRKQLNVLISQPGIADHRLKIDGISLEGEDGSVGAKMPEQESLIAIARANIADTVRVKPFKQRTEQNLGVSDHAGSGLPFDAPQRWKSEGGAAVGELSLRDRLSRISAIESQ